MKKKLLAAAIMAAMTLSASAALAAPIAISGDGYLEYNNTQSGDSRFNGLDSRVRVSFDGNVDNNIKVHARLVQGADLSTNFWGNQAKFDTMYIAGNVGGVNLQVGKDDVFTGKGLLIDDHNFSGIKASTDLGGLQINGFVGKDGDGIKTRTADMKTSFDGINFGANYVVFNDNHFYGVNADTKVGDVVLSGEYVKNDSKDASGYLAAAKMGAYTVSYRDIDENAASTAGHNTNSNYDNSKGFRVSATYGLNKNSSVTMYQDFATEKSTGNDKHRTNVQFDYNF